MNINADFAQRIVIHSEQLAWQASPMAGVERRMLDRVGDEVARATSVVRYAPGSHFAPHVHTGGEEFVVLKGVFQDEHGDYPAGSYVRNPPESSHTPRSENGCTILVKLWQFDLQDRTKVVANMNELDSCSDLNESERASLLLHADEREKVCIEVWKPGATVTFEAPGGAEIFVLEGGFEDNGDLLTRHSWLRIPVNGRLQARAGETGARVWLKMGGLQFAGPPALTDHGSDAVDRPWPDADAW